MYKICEIVFPVLVYIYITLRQILSLLCYFGQTSFCHVFYVLTDHVYALFRFLLFLQIFFDRAKNASKSIH